MFCYHGRMISTNGKTHQRDISVSMVKANWFSLAIALPILILLALAYIGIWGIDQPLITLRSFFQRIYVGPLSFLLALSIFLVVYGAGVVAHEFIHGFTWKVAGRLPWRAMHFGFQVSTFTPYSHCLEPLPAWAYRLGTFMPGLLTGLIPALGVL